MNTWASFVVARLPNGRFAATTRPGGGIGLPGGKLEAGETAVQAAYREAAEEGWEVVGLVPIHKALVDGRPVEWFLARAAFKLAEFKEAGRIEPIEAYKCEIVDSGLGNDGLPWDVIIELTR